MASDSPLFVSRGGLKLHHALTTFNLCVQGLHAVDLGCSTGGFTHCLLHHGAARVHSIDTAYGQLAWKLRIDPRVVVIERTNALHAAPPKEGLHLAVADLGWTPQRLLIPAALRWLAPSNVGIISLIKPHYELKDTDPSALPKGGILSPHQSQQVLDSTLARLPALGVTLRAVTPSPLLGGAHKGKGNIEFLAWLTPTTPP